jgi:hypothetical protein
LGVSQRTIVPHWFGDTYEFAKDQWQQDGKGLGRMVVKYGFQALPLLGIPIAGAIRGSLISLVRLQPKWIRYYFFYFLYNYSSILSGLSERVAKPEIWMQPTVR